MLPHTMSGRIAPPKIFPIRHPANRPGMAAGVNRGRIASAPPGACITRCPDGYRFIYIFPDTTLNISRLPSTGNEYIPDQASGEQAGDGGGGEQRQNSERLCDPHLHFAERKRCEYISEILYFLRPLNKQLKEKERRTSALSPFLR